MELKEILKMTFDAGDEYGTAGEFGRQGVNFDKWYLKYEKQFEKISFNPLVMRSVCFHKTSTWNEGAGCYVCDDCNERV